MYAGRTHHSQSMFANSVRKPKLYIYILGTLKHWPYLLATTMDCGCSKMVLNWGLFFHSSRFLGENKDALEMKWTYWLWHYFTTISGHFFQNYNNIFHKTEVLINILRCQTCLILNWIKNYDIKHSFVLLPFFSIL